MGPYEARGVTSRLAGIHSEEASHESTRGVTDTEREVRKVSDTDDGALLGVFQGVEIDHCNKKFYRGLLDRELRLNRCRECGFWRHPPKPRCPQCWSTNIEARAVSGFGTIHLLTLLAGVSGGAEESAPTPHPVVTIELDEQPGLRFTSTVVGAGPDDIRIGQRVRLDWIESESRPLPVFRILDPA